MANLKDLLVKGIARFSDKIYADNGIEGNLTGTASRATADANGNDIANTYATKSSIPSGVTVDSALSSTSTNPVQNKVINSALSGKLSTSGTAAKATADASGNNIASTYATKSSLAKVATSGSYNDLSNKPSIPSSTTLPLSSGTASKTSFLSSGTCTYYKYGRLVIASYSCSFASLSGTKILFSGLPSAANSKFYGSILTTNVNTDDRGSGYTYMSGDKLMISSSNTHLEDDIIYGSIVYIAAS